MNPYETLGLDKSASDEEVKRAYKREAQRTHPDKEGGSEEAFKAVQQAYELLSNPDRRRHYDETGDSDEARRQLLADSLVSLFMTYVNDARVDPDHNDLVITLKKHLVEAIAGFRKDAQIIRKTRVRYSRTMKRIHRRSPGPNVFADELASRIADLEKQLDRKAADIREAEDAAKFLDDYEYDLITPVSEAPELPQAALLRWNKAEA